MPAGFCSPCKPNARWVTWPPSKPAKLTPAQSIAGHKGAREVVPGGDLAECVPAQDGDRDVGIGGCVVSKGAFGVDACGRASASTGWTVRVGEGLGGGQSGKPGQCMNACMPLPAASPTPAPRGPQGRESAAVRLLRSDLGKVDAAGDCHGGVVNRGVAAAHNSREACSIQGGEEAKRRHI